LSPQQGEYDEPAKHSEDNLKAMIGRIPTTSPRKPTVRGPDDHGGALDGSQCPDHPTTKGVAGAALQQGVVANHRHREPQVSPPEFFQNRALKPGEPGLSHH
jgi:hypothetical protein